jgi:hypothetical protein
MKVLAILAAFIFAIFLVSTTPRITAGVSAQNGKKPPETITLGADAKLGQIKFNHLDHVSKGRGVDGAQLACVECHHTAQPASEAVKHPPHKTAWPADRTTTLTAELLEKDPSAPAVNACRDCHARADTKPKLLPEIPQVKFEGSAEPTIMTNQQAFHHNCGTCHDEVAKKKPDSTAPTSKKCMACHKKAAA